MKKLFVIFLLICIDLYPYSQHNYNDGTILKNIKMQTDVNNAKFIIKEKIPYLDIKNVGIVFHPAWTALYALQYAGAESYYPKQVTPDKDAFLHAVSILEEKLTYLDDNSTVWLYNFDNTYNNIYIKAPWYSSFAQAVGIEVFVTAYETTNDKRYLKLAKKVANALFVPLQKGGLLYQDGQDIWFEEIPLKKSPTHILNAQLRTLIALEMLYNATKEKKYKSYFDQGLVTLKRWLPRYDTGHWLRYDLNPKTKQMFRLTNPYGFKTIPLAIDSISVLDENKSILFSEDIGDKDDFDNNKSIYLSGKDWKSAYMENNSSYRTIKSVHPTPFKIEFDSQILKAPYTFIYVDFPSQKYQKYYLKISYKDKTKGNLLLQKRSIQPKMKFIDFNNGLFLLKGDNKERSLIAPITDNQFGFHTGLSYAQKHYLYLNKLLHITHDRKIKQWTDVAKAYRNTNEYTTDKKITLSKVVLPNQTPILPLFSFDKDSVIRQHQPSKKTKLIKEINKISKNGLKSLEKYLDECDTGYWSKYDQIPKKELLFQFDWIKGKKSPLVDEICLISTLSHTKTCLDIGAIQDANTSNKISGVDWQARNKIDGKTVRSFQNGYKKRNHKVQRGIQHNVFARLCLPDREFEEYWKITPYYLSIKYKDIEEGQFNIKIQSIRGGGFLEFMPLTLSNIFTVGDAKWKEHIIPIKTNDLGWSMGVDYHKYHIMQLKELSEKTDNTILTQTTDRWKYYLDLYELRQTPIVEPKKIYFHQLDEYNITSNLKYYKGYELENSLDEDTKNNYSASSENIPLPHSLDINLPNSKFLNRVQLIWESKQNSAKEYIIYAYHKNKLVHEQSINNLNSNNTIYVDKLCDKLIIKINKYNGQKRLLLRGIRIYGK